MLLRDRVRVVTFGTQRADECGFPGGAVPDDRDTERADALTLPDSSIAAALDERDIRGDAE